MNLPYSRKQAKQWALGQLKGFYEAPITPLTQDFKIDEAAIRENVEAYIDIGVSGLVVAGNVAEAWNMTPSEWYRLNEIYADAVRGRVDLWTIVLDPSPRVALEKMERCQQLGYTGAEVMNPSVQLISDAETFNYFEYISKNSDMAIVLYRTPVSGRVMSYSLMQRIADLDTVVGTKQGSLIQGDTVRLRRMIRPDFIVSEALEPWYLNDLKHGGQVSWAAFFYLAYGKLRPKVKEYWDLGLAGKWEEAERVSEQLDPMREIVDDIMVTHVVKTSSYASAIAYMKVIMEAVGFKAGPAMPPVATIDGAEREKLIARIQKVGAC